MKRWMLCAMLLTGGGAFAAPPSPPEAAETRPTAPAGALDEAAAEYVRLVGNFEGLSYNKCVEGLPYCRLPGVLARYYDLDHLRVAVEDLKRLVPPLIRSGRLDEAARFTKDTFRRVKKYRGGGVLLPHQTVVAVADVNGQMLDRAVGYLELVAEGAR